MVHIVFVVWVEGTTCGGGGGGGKPLSVDFIYGWLNNNNLTDLILRFSGWKRSDQVRLVLRGVIKRIRLLCVTAWCMSVIMPTVAEHGAVFALLKKCYKH